MSLPPAGQWKPEPPTPGTWVEFDDGGGFTVTLHGPLVERSCVDCGAVCAATLECADPRCGACLLVASGADVIDRAALQERPPRFIGTPPASRAYREEALRRLARGLS